MAHSQARTEAGRFTGSKMSESDLRLLLLERRSTRGSVTLPQLAEAHGLTLRTLKRRLREAQALEDGDYAKQARAAADRQADLERQAREVEEANRQPDGSVLTGITREELDNWARIDPAAVRKMANESRQTSRLLCLDEQARDVQYADGSSAKVFASAHSRPRRLRDHELDREVEALQRAKNIRDGLSADGYDTYAFGPIRGSVDMRDPADIRRVKRLAASFGVEWEPRTL